MPARVSVKINNKNIKKKVEPLIKKELAKVSGKIVSDITAFFEERLEQSPVVNSLYGLMAGTDFDLAAEFGLPDPPFDAISDIVDVVGATISVNPLKPDRTKSAVIARFSITGLAKRSYESKIKSLSSGVSLRPKSGHVVPWLEWLITGDPDVDSDYGISFDLTTKMAASSLTGRALMLDEEHYLIERFPYKLPRGYRGGRGDHFIDSIIQTKSFQTQIQKIALNHLKKIGK